MYHLPFVGMIFHLIDTTGLLTVVASKFAISSITMTLVTKKGIRKANLCKWTYVLPLILSQPCLIDQGLLCYAGQLCSVL